MVPLLSGEGSFGEQHFGAAVLGDARRTKRLVELADQMQKHPGGTLPHKITNPMDLKALYRLMDTEEVTHESVLASHLARTGRKIAEQEDVVLIIHDTTELDYTTKYSLNLGQIGNGMHRGYLCHNSLAITTEGREVIGLTSQILHHRPIKTKGRKKKKQTASQRRKAQDRESRLWVQGVEKSERMAAWKRGEGTGPKVVDLCDRGADTFEFLEYERKHGRHFVIRSARNRALVGAGYLHAFARTLPPLGYREFEVQPNLARSGRTAKVAVAAAQVSIKPPKQKRGEHSSEPLSLTVIRVWEIDPPKEAKCEKPLEWILLTDETAETFEQAATVVDWYSTRPLIEEFHKGQKTGCRIEHMNFAKAERLEPAIALISVVALTLLSLRDASRRPDARVRQATELLHPDYVRVLSQWRHKQDRMNWSIHDFYYALGRLGGHQNRNSDHPPGWLVLWRGWETLQAMLLGDEIARRREKRCG